MTTAIARRDDAGTLAIRPGQELFDDKQKAGLAVLGIRDCDNANLAVFMHYCQKTQLDPFSRQIYYIKRKEKQGDIWVDKWTIQVGIDGFRVMRDRVAERTGCTVEFEDTIWYDAKGGEHTVWLSAEPPAACKVVMVKYQDGRALRFPAVLRTASYAQTDKQGNWVSQWKTQAEHMIEKCCEAFSTRRAFPNDFSGVYLEDEMQGRGDAGQPPPAHRKVTVAEIIPPDPEDPTPAGSAATAASPGATTERKTRAGQPASPKQVDELNELLARLPLGVPDEREADERTLLGWLAGGEWTATVAQVRDVLSVLRSFVEAAGGDTEAAVTAIWTRYHEVNGGGNGG